MNKRLKLIVIFLLPVLSYLFMTIHFDQLKQYDTDIFVGDQSDYFEGSEAFYHHFQADAYRTIGYPLLLGLPELMGLKPPYAYWPIILNFIFLFGALFILLKIDKRLNTSVALPASIILSICFGFIWQLNMALTELGYAFFLIFSLLNFIRFLRAENKTLPLFLFIFSLGCTALFRPGFYIFAILTSIACILISVITGLKQQKTGSIFKSILVTIIALAITIGSQSLLMKKTFNTNRLSYIDDLTWYLYIGALANTIYENNCFSGKCFDEERKLRQDVINNSTLEEVSLFGKKDRQDLIQNKKAALFKAYKINLTNNLVSAGGWKEESPAIIYRFAVFTNQVLSILPFIIYLLIIIVTKFRKKITTQEHIVLIFILSIIGYSVSLSGISTYQGDRFHIVFYPISIFLIVFSFLKIKRVRNKQVSTI